MWPWMLMSPAMRKRDTSWGHLWMWTQVWFRPFFKHFLRGRHTWIPLGFALPSNCKSQLRFIHLVLWLWDVSICVYIQFYTDFIIFVHHANPTSLRPDVSSCYTLSQAASHVSPQEICCSFLSTSPHRKSHLVIVGSWLCLPLSPMPLVSCMHLSSLVCHTHTVGQPLLFSWGYLLKREHYTGLLLNCCGLDAAVGLPFILASITHWGHQG